MSKRWGVWSRLFIVLGVLWTVGFPVFAWVMAYSDAVQAHDGWLRYCRAQPYVDEEVTSACINALPLTPPTTAFFWEAAGVGIALMAVSIVLFVIVRAVVRWILAGRNRAA